MTATAAAVHRDGPHANLLARAVAWAGADAVRFALARAVPGRPLAIEAEIIARHVMSNPAYAVRYAHARAASGVRWAATGSEAAAAPRHRPADPGELVLLDALSWLPERVATAARRGRPDEFARYLEELASATIAALIPVGLNPAGHPGSARAPAGRLAVATAARTGLAAGLGLLGVGAPGRL
jgi:arginyl-tRNA synthetase